MNQPETQEEGGIVAHAIRELTAAKMLGSDDEYNAWMAESVIEIAKVFAGQGHSGLSAALTLSMLKRVLAYEPLTPLTGDDSEWVEVREGLWQNKRLSSVFKEGDAPAYWIDGRIFSDDGGKSWFTNHESRVSITFPWMPSEPERVLVKP